jgi:hypothetical protein
MILLTNYRILPSRAAAGNVAARRLIGIYAQGPTSSRKGPILSNFGTRSKQGTSPVSQPLPFAEHDVHSTDSFRLWPASVFPPPPQ